MASIVLYCFQTYLVLYKSYISTYLIAIRKKDETMRICIDYNRKLNKVTANNTKCLFQIQMTDHSYVIIFHPFKTFHYKASTDCYPIVDNFPWISFK